ncbi:hypothetical protein KP509_35G025100 [Ceratopteris richardii]|nr:hypothetical protein KP509_35G025100 [Ceratopteris richardii]
MAAAEAATAPGTRRTVVCSERFIQWQEQLNSVRRSPCGSRKHSAGNHNQRKESKNSDVSKGPDAMEKGLDACDNHSTEVSLAMGAQRLEPQDLQQQSKICKGFEKHNSLEHERDSLFISHAGICELATKTVEHSQVELKSKIQQQQHELVSTLPCKRRGRRASKKDQGTCSLVRDGGYNSNAKVEPTNVNKRSTRLLTRTLRTEEPPPPPFKFPKLQVVLSRKEVQEDWLKITGRRYTGKPKKSVLTHLGLGLCTSLTCPSTLRRYLNDS